MEGCHVSIGGEMSFPWDLLQSTSEARKPEIRALLKVGFSSSLFTLPFEPQAVD